MFRFLTTLVAALSLLLIAGGLDTGKPIFKTDTPSIQSVSYSPGEVERVEFLSFSDLSSLEEELNYTSESWAAGQSLVPRLVLLKVPPRFGDESAEMDPVEQKKETFFRMILPLVLMANEEVLSDRETLEKLKKELEGTRFPTADQLQQLRDLAEKYGLPEDGDVQDIDKIIEILERRVDVVPPSLGLAQAATESGWGSSRFAVEGNALFGQWTFGGKGMLPEEQREEKGDYRVASFETPLQSVRSYIRNLNTNPAYREFRQRRLAARKAGKPISGRTLVATLTRYSERGQAYISDLRSIMEANGLFKLDKSRLAGGTVYELLPVWRGES